MITYEKHIKGSKKDLLEYFSFIKATRSVLPCKTECYEMDKSSIFSQLDKIENTFSRVGKVFYFEVKESNGEVVNIQLISELVEVSPSQEEIEKEIEKIKREFPSQNS